MLAKKYNKSREQKPNYTKRGMKNLSVEAGTDLDLENKIKEQKNLNQCFDDNTDECFSPKKK